jgi:hypothetical protein
MHNLGRSQGRRELRAIASAEVPAGDQMRQDRGRIVPPTEVQCRKQLAVARDCAISAITCALRGRFGTVCRSRAPRQMHLGAKCLCR